MKKRHKVTSIISTFALATASVAPSIGTALPTYAATNYSTYDSSKSYDEKLQEAINGTQLRRTHYPTKAEPMYNARSAGGTAFNPYGKCVGVNGMKDLASALPNCVAYAWGRTYETLGYGTAKLLWEGSLKATSPTPIWKNAVSTHVFNYGVVTEKDKKGNIVIHKNTVPKNNSLLLTSNHIIYVEKVISHNADGTYTLAVSDSNYSANGHNKNDSWYSQTCKDGAWRNYTTVFNPKTGKHGRTASYQTRVNGFIYITEPHGANHQADAAKAPETKYQWTNIPS